MTPEQHAAHNLIVRALKAQEQSTADLLIMAAQKLDPTMNADAVRQIWLNQWLENNQNRNGEPSQ